MTVSVPTVDGDAALMYIFFEIFINYIYICTLCGIHVLGHYSVECILIMLIVKAKIT